MQSSATWEPRLETLCSECVSGGLRLVSLSCLDSADECSTASGGFHVSAKAEPVVAHRACQVCRYCNDGVATRTMEKSQMMIKRKKCCGASTRVARPDRIEPCMYECRGRLNPVTSLMCGSKVYCRVRTCKLLPIKPNALYLHRNLARGEVVHERSGKGMFRHIRSSDE